MRTTNHLVLSLLLASTLGCGGPEGSNSDQGVADANTPATGTKSTPAVQMEEAQGYFLVGRVADPWGDGIPEARVWVVPSGEPGDSQAIAETVSDDQGRFEVEAPGPGPWTVHARHTELGIQRVELPLLARGETRRVPDLRLIGEGRIAGRLLDAARNPLADVSILAYSKSLLHQELFGTDAQFDVDSLPLYPPLLDNPFYVRGEGFNFVEVTTDSDGGFLFEGLAPGDFLIYAVPLGGGAWSNPKRSWYATGSEDLELVSPMCSLEVSVADDGVASASADESQRRRLGAILVFPTIPAARGRAAILSQAREVHGSERNVFWLDPGQYIIRGVTFPPMGQWGLTLHAETLVEIVPGEATKAVELRFAPQDRPSGRLKVNVTVPESFAVPEKFHFLTVETGQPIEVSSFSPFPEPRYGEWLEVPEGEYLVALKPFEDFTGRHEVVDMANIYRRVVVEAGKDTEVTLDSTFGGRFRLKLSADRFMLGKDLLANEEALSGEWESNLRQLSKEAGATIALHRDDGGPTLELRLSDPVDLLGQRRKRMLPGELFENFEPVEPGDYTLWVLLEGFDPLELPVTIRERGTTDVSGHLIESQ